LDRRLGGPKSRSGRHGEVKILATLPDSNFNPVVVQPVALIIIIIIIISELIVLLNVS
jgi:hypothetical protein